ncbi:Serine/Threonine-kinase TNNI3K, partial [Rhizoctonia solani AG-3 Rhs1AP]
MFSVLKFSASVAHAQWASDFEAVRKQEMDSVEHIRDELANIGVDLHSMDEKIDLMYQKVEGIEQSMEMLKPLVPEINQLREALEKLLVPPPTPTSSDAQKIVDTILSFTNLEVPLSLLLDRRCTVIPGALLEANDTCKVYPALLGNGEKVAKKVYRFEVLDRQVLNRDCMRFVRLAKLWCTLQSSYILPFYGIGMESHNDDFRLYMVSPLMQNRDATIYLERNRDKPGMKANILQITTDAAIGLRYLHSLRPQVVHSGMKGSNILITDSGRGVLSGFGLTKALIVDLGPNRTVRLTGKPKKTRWMAPEMFQKDAALETPIDVWGWAMATLEVSF